MTPDTFPAALVEEMAQRQHEMRRERYPLSVTLPWGDISDDDKEAVRECVRGVLSALPADVQAVARGEAVAVPVSVRRLQHAVTALITEGHKTLAAELAGAASYLPEWAQEPQR